MNMAEEEQKRNAMEMAKEEKKSEEKREIIKEEIGESVEAITEETDTMTKNSKVKDMTVGNPIRLILFFSIPILIGNIFQQLYNMVDTIIVGQCIDMTALAAVGTTGPMSFLVLGFCMGLTSGFGVLIAQSFGAKDEKRMRHCIGITTILCVVLTATISVLAVLMTRPLLKMINTPDDVIDQAYSYIVIIFAGIGATVLYNMLACILRAIGDSKTPLYFLMISSVLNICLDLLFIVNFEMGVGGAALATVVSQGVSGLMCLVYIYKKFPILHLARKDFKWDAKLAWKHLAIGLPMAFQFSITAIGVIVLQGALNLFGSQKMAAYTAASKVEQLLSQPANTFGVTMANYCGQNLGAGRIDRVRKGVVQASFLSLSFAVFGMLIMTLFGADLAHLFIKADTVAEVEEIISYAMQYLRMATLFYPFLFMIFIYRNAMQGIGQSLLPLLAGVLELVTRTVVALTLPGMIGYQGICLTGPMAWLTAAVYLFICYQFVIRKVTKQYSGRPGMVV